MLRPALLLASAGFILWRVVTLGLSAHALEGGRSGDPRALLGDNMKT